MEYNRIRAAIPKPCASCSRQELLWLREKHRVSEEEFWVYTIPAYHSCHRCVKEVKRGVVEEKGFFQRVLPTIAQACCPFIDNNIQVPIPMYTVGLVERAIHAASVSEKGSEYRAHGTFIHHLSNLDIPEREKQALCAWAPAAMGGYMNAHYGVTRKYSKGRPVRTAPAIPESHTPTGGGQQDQPTAALTSAALKPPPGLEPPPNVDRADMIIMDDNSGNPDVVEENGVRPMYGTQLQGDEYGQETRVKKVDQLQSLYPPADPKVLAHQIGPDLIPTEVMQSTVGNLQAGLAKRVQPLPFKPSKHLENKINSVVSKLIVEVFPKSAIHKWREENPLFSEMASKKWTPARFRNAYNNLNTEVDKKITHEFQIKVNEALPAKGKAPRPIITSGDEGQIAMLLPVKCFEHLLFKYFKDASIKGVDKHSAMKRVAEHLRFKPRKNGSRPTIIEGDGSAWDACCNGGIRNMTENRIIEHIIQCLGQDAEVPKAWLHDCLRDMKEPQIRGKAKVDEQKRKNPVRIVIDSIRQSGHRGTSAFNWLINYVCWVSVMCQYPDQMVVKRKGQLRKQYVSSFDGRSYEMCYAFEGDDSVLSTNESISEDRQKHIIEQWTSMGFRMKLVFGGQKMTFTGFDFLCDEYGPTETFIPELPRNIASSSWTCSDEAKSHPEKVNQIGAAAMLARAENFKDCGPFAKYFAELGLAHTRVCGDCEIGEVAAMKLGIAPVESVVDRLNEAAQAAAPMSDEMRQLVQLSCPISVEQEARLLTCHFDNWQAKEARWLIPTELWDRAKNGFEEARR